MLKMINNFEEISFPLNEPVLKQGEEIEYLYLIKNGAFEINYQVTKNITSSLDINFFSMINEWIVDRFYSARQCEVKGSYPVKHSTRVGL